MLFASSIIPYTIALLSSRRILNRTGIIWFLSAFTSFFLLTAGYCFWKVDDLPPSQLQYFLTQTAVLWMKYHSYVCIIADTPSARVSITDYMYFLFAPTLVYQTQFKRTERIRWGYVLERVVLAAIIFGGMHTVNYTYVSPLLAQVLRLSMLEFVSQLLVPLSCFYVLMFFFVFECILKCEAELLRFEDRRFYDDWWNSTTFDEFSRRWNRPVYQWLNHHIYQDARERNDFSKGSALAITFIFSTICHELLLMTFVRSWKPFMAPLQLTQIVLIKYGGLFKGTKIGNYFFHVCIGVGVPLLTCFYAREYALNRSITIGEEASL